jgi:hypothetical protein
MSHTYMFDAGQISDLGCSEFDSGNVTHNMKPVMRFQVTYSPSPSQRHLNGRQVSVVNAKSTRALDRPFPLKR